MVAVVATLAALAALGRDAFVALPDVKPITAMTLVVGLRARPAARLHRRRARHAGLEHRARPGPVHAVADGRLGARRSGRRGARHAQRAGASGRVQLALACALAALAAKEVMNVYTWTLGASHTPAALLRDGRHGAAVRPHRHGRELPLRPRLRAGAGAAAGADARAHGGELGGGRADRRRRLRRRAPSERSARRDRSWRSCSSPASA